MTNDLFAEELQHVHYPPFCAGCGKQPTTVFPSAKDRQAFRQMTGLTWRPPHISLNLRQDRQTLGYSVAGLPERVIFCLPCSVEYMRRFNSLHTERLAKATP